MIEWPLLMVALGVLIVWPDRKSQRLAPCYELENPNGKQDRRPAR